MCPEPENRVCPPAHDEWLALFDEMPFAERMRRMISGLRAPHDSGAYKFARLQRQRLSAPFAAGIAPLLALVVLLLLGAVRRDTKPMGGVVKIYDRPREKPALTPLPKPEPSPDTRSSRSLLEPVFEPVMTSSAPLPLSPQQVHPGRPVRWLKPVGFKGPDQGIAGGYRRCAATRWRPLHREGRHEGIALAEGRTARGRVVAEAADRHDGAGAVDLSCAWRDRRISRVRPDGRARRAVPRQRPADRWPFQAARWA